jgi:hypothetical protein
MVGLAIEAIRLRLRLAQDPVVHVGDAGALDDDQPIEPRAERRIRDCDNSRPRRSGVGEHVRVPGQDMAFGIVEAVWTLFALRGYLMLFAAATRHEASESNPPGRA